MPTMRTGSAGRPAFTTLELKITYACNSKCLYCCAGNRRGSPTMTSGEILANVDHFASRHGIRGVCLSGGEPTLHRDFLALLRAIDGKGLTLYLHTNAIRFRDPEFAASCAPFLDRVLVGFSAHEKGLGDLLTGDGGTLGNRLEGLRNLRRGSFPVRTNTVMLKQNFRHLPEMAAILRDVGMDRCLLTFPFFFEPGTEQIRSFVPDDYDEVRPFLEKAVDLLRKGGIAVSIQGLPACRLGDLAEFREIDPDRAFVDARHQFEDFQMLFSGALGYFKTPSCRGCSYEPDCWGFPRAGAFGRFGERLGLPGAGEPESADGDPR